jgi:uncharacterized protein
MTPWTQTVERIAREAALAEDRRRWNLSAESSGSPPLAYRWEHVQVVVRLARQLAEAENGDIEIVVAAAWLHDTRKDQPEHGLRGAELARDVLATTDFPAAKIEAVAHAIAHHEGLWRPMPGWADPDPFVPAPPLSPLETAILWDADKLAKVGPTGFIHNFACDLARGAAWDVRQVDAWWREHFPRTLASFNTATARKWGRERYLLTLRFLDALISEASASQND